MAGKRLKTCLHKAQLENMLPCMRVFDHQTNAQHVTTFSFMLLFIYLFCFPPTQGGATSEVHLSKRPLLALFPDNYVGDALNSTLQGGVGNRGDGPRLVLRKKAFKRDHGAPINAEHLALAYGQVVGDMQAGVYVPLHVDAARLAALQLVARYGAGLLQDGRCIAEALPSVLPAAVLAANPSDSLAAVVGQQYASLADLSAAECQLLVLAAVAKVPFGTLE